MHLPAYFTPISPKNIQAEISWRFTFSFRKPWTYSRIRYAHMDLHPITFVNFNHLGSVWNVWLERRQLPNSYFATHLWRNTFTGPINLVYYRRCIKYKWCWPKLYKEKIQKTTTIQYRINETKYISSCGLTRAFRTGPFCAVI